MMIMSDIHHMSPKRCQKIAFERKQSDHNVIDDVDNVWLMVADINPAFSGNIESAFEI